jgi:hypothetical protein
MFELTAVEASYALTGMPGRRQAPPARKVPRKSTDPRPPRRSTWTAQVTAVQREVSRLFHSPLPRKLAGKRTVLLSLRTINIILNGLLRPDRHDPVLIEKLNNVARGGNMYSAAGADILDAVLHARTIKLIWPDELADGIRERLSEYGSAFSTETTERIDQLFRHAEPTNLKTFAAPVADLVIGAWVRAGRPDRQRASVAFDFPVEPKATDARTRRALLTRILNAIARHDDGPSHDAPKPSRSRTE